MLITFLSLTQDICLQEYFRQDSDIVEVVPKIMQIIIDRLEALYMRIAANAPHDPILRRIPPLTRWARDFQNIQQFQGR